MSRSLVKDPPAVADESARLDSLYERDLYGWLNQQVALLRAGRLDELDAFNLAGELDAVSRSQAAKLWSLLRVLVMHMLKWDQQPEMRTASWVHSIREQRRRYRKLIADNPSPQPRRDELLADAYGSARDWAANETNLPEDEFPRDCPYDWNDTLERPFEMDPKR